MMRSFLFKLQTFQEFIIFLDRIYKTQDVLASIIKENTNRLELLQVISHEKKELVNIINAQPKKKEQVEKIEGIQEKYNESLEKLEKFVEEQQKQIQDLKLEIKMLKTKGMPRRERRRDELKNIIKEQVETEQAERGEHVSPPEERDVIETKESEEVTVIMEFKDETGPYVAEAEYVVRDMLDQLLGDVDARLSRLSIENIVKSILSGVLFTTSVVDIIHEIVRNLPITPSSEQLAIIDESAEKLHQLHEISTSEESLVNCVHELLEDVLDEVMMVAGAPHDVVFKMVNKLVDVIPSEILLSERSLATISDKIKDIVEGKRLDTDELRSYIERVPQHYREMMAQIINAILERVYGEGIDYIYIIKHE
ncbi:unnamed protein product [Acanthoscelides obtectus]|uniref:Uncharacterized protein n=1 Tax=Acanthoscelides obtectus TaxID=200917 RepID=A0A9P0JNK9_ACAOB|nr:unnamed protein product [Acanthoscelides obtectus]CAK1673887.1 hypothetical protein AOBTE_LOCUS29467 [Acanthoscelides obtectus]